MDNFKRVFLLAALLCVSALALSFAVTRRLNKERPTSEVLWHKSLEQLKQICRHKYRQSLHHTAYAHHAERDSLHAEAALLHAIAHAEAVQCDNCRQAIGALGGTFSLPTIRPTEFSEAMTHIHNTLQDKQLVRREFIPTAIEQAIKDNNRYVARMLTWCDASDAKQILLLQRLLGEEKPHHVRYRVCPTCGDIIWLEESTRYCPHCMTDSVKFFVVER